MARKRQRQAKPKDDLKKIEGIGPKIENILINNGIDSFARLARTSVERLKSILWEAGSTFKSRDPTTWPNQAGLAKTGEWDELKSLQKKLNGGRTKIPSGKAGQAAKKQPAATVVFSGVDGGVYEPGQPFLIERLLSSEEELLEFHARRDELSQEFERMEPCAEALWQRIQKLDEFAHHICGVSIRYRTKLGHPVSPLRPVVAVNVARKLSQEELDDLGYRSIEACCCDLPEKLHREIKVLEGSFGLLDSEAGFFLRGTGAPKQALSFGETVTGGVPIHRPADPLSNYGTLGIVSIAENRLPMAITAQHVVGTDRNVEQIDDSGNDRLLGTVPEVNEAPFNVSVAGKIESIDAAVVELLEQDSIALPKIGEWARAVSHSFDLPPGSENDLSIYYSTRRIGAGDKGRQVIKFGNGSGVVALGKVDSINQSTNIFGDTFNSNFTIEPYPNSNGPFVAPGDSGAIVATMTGSANGNSEPSIVVVGILFAGLVNQTRGVVCNMNAVVEGLNLQQTLVGSKFSNDWS